MSYKNTPKSISPGLGGWTYQGNVSLGDPPPAGFYVDQTSMSSGAPTFEINVTDASGISHLDWLQDLINTNHLVLRERNRPANSLVLEISSNSPGAGFQTIVGDIRSGNGTFVVGVTYDIWEVTTSEDLVIGPEPSTATSIPTFSDTAGKVLQDNPDLRFGLSNELELDSAAAAIEIQERNTPPANAGAKGHVWVRDDVPNTLVFTDDIGGDLAFSDYIVGPASSDTDAIPTFSDTTGKLIKNNDLLYDTGELQLTAATAALEIQERATAPTDAPGTGHVWVKDDAPNTLTFTDDIGTDYPLHGLEKSVALGTWSFGASTLGTPASGVFDTDNATLTSITAVRFNGTPASGQTIISWSVILPQEGILYLQDTTNPGGTSVTFPFTSVTFPAGASYPQFNGPALSTNGTVQGTNWSVNNYSLQIVGMTPTLEEIINGDSVDNDVIVPSTIFLSDNTVTFTPLTIISTNATSATPSVLITRPLSTDIGLKAVFNDGLGWHFSSNKIEATKNVPSSNITYYFEPEDTTSGTYHGRDVELEAGDHSGSQRGGNLTLNGGDGSPNYGIVYIGINGAVSEEMTISTGFSLVEGPDHPVAAASGKAQVWLSTEFDETTQPGVNIHDGHVLKMTQYQDHDIEMSWLAANYKHTLGARLAFGHTEEHGNVGGATKTSGDSDVSYIYDHLGNMFYQAFIEDFNADALVSSSVDGYTWASFKNLDTSAFAMAQPCTNGTKLGVAVDGNFYLSTDLTSANLPGTATGTAGSITRSTGLVWHIGSQLWVMCGENGTNGYIYTSPTGTTWTNRTPAGLTGNPTVSMDIAHPGYGGYTANERILIVCGAGLNDTFWSDNGTSWNQDTTGNPTAGLEHVVWAPSIRTNNSKDKATSGGAWVGMDAAKNLYISRLWDTGTWDDTNTTCDWIGKTDEFCWYATSAAAGLVATNMYTIDNVTDTGALVGGWIRGRHVGVLDDYSKPMFRCSDSARARYTWGNGVIMYDREDGEFIIGRYGPIT